MVKVKQMTWQTKEHLKKCVFKHVGTSNIITYRRNYKTNLLINSLKNLQHKEIRYKQLIDI